MSCNRWKSLDKAREHKTLPYSPQTQDQNLGKPDDSDKQICTLTVLTFQGMGRNGEFKARTTV